MSPQPVALVSGANRGIGREIARQLRDQHDFLVLAGTRRPEGDQVELDVADSGSVELLAERVADDPGRLDVLVNNAGIYGDHSPAGDYDLAKAHQVLEVNLFGAWRLTQAMLPLLRRSEHGRIVNVSSGGGQLDDMQGGGAAYRVSKTGMNALTRILAVEEASAGILVNSLCPGWVRTDMGGSNAPRSVEEGADTAVWLATLPDDGPSGGFFRDREPIPW